MPTEASRGDWVVAWWGPWPAEKHVPHEKKTAATQPQPVVAVWECGMHVTTFSAWSGKTGNLKKFLYQMSLFL